MSEGSESNQKYLIRDAQGNVYGPADAAMLRDWVGQGRIVAGMFIAERETRQWIEASVHPVVSDLLSRGKQSIAPTPQKKPPQVPHPPAAPSSAGAETPRLAPGAPQTPVKEKQDEGLYDMTPPPPAEPAYVQVVEVDEPVMAFQSEAQGARQNVPGLLSMIFGIASFVFLPCAVLCGCVGIPISTLLAVTAVVLGVISLNQFRENAAAYTGKGMAIAGLCIGGVLLLIYLLGLIVVLVVKLVNP